MLVAVSKTHQRSFSPNCYLTIEFSSSLKVDRERCKGHTLVRILEARIEGDEVERVIRKYWQSTKLQDFAKCIVKLKDLKQSLLVYLNLGSAVEWSKFSNRRFGAKLKVRRIEERIESDQACEWHYTQSWATTSFSHVCASHYSNIRTTKICERLKYNILHPHKTAVNQQKPETTHLETAKFSLSWPSTSCIQCKTDKNFASYNQIQCWRYSINSQILSSKVAMDAGTVPRARAEILTWPSNPQRRHDLVQVIFQASNDHYTRSRVYLQMKKALMPMNYEREVRV